MYIRRACTHDSAGTWMREEEYYLIYRNECIYLRSIPLWQAGTGTGNKEGRARVRPLCAYSYFTTHISLLFLHLISHLISYLIIYTYPDSSDIRMSPAIIAYIWCRLG